LGEEGRGKGRKNREKVEKNQHGRNGKKNKAKKGRIKWLGVGKGRQKKETQG